MASTSRRRRRNRTAAYATRRSATAAIAQRWDHPEFGPLWVASMEDLVLAKLEWSSGVSELQLKDCRNLIVANRDTLDWPYLERWARALGVIHVLQRVRDAA